MNTTFNKLGIKLSENNVDPNNTPIIFYYINNTDGTPRWIWPSHLEKPLFLNFYTIIGLKSFLIATIIKLIFIFRLQHLIFPKKLFYVTKNKTVLDDFNIKSNWSIFTGTVGINNKTILYFESNNLSSFVKIAGTDCAKKILHNETYSLFKAYHTNYDYIEVPEVIYHNEEILQLTDISNKGSRSNILTKTHELALNEIFHKANNKLNLSSNSTWQDLKNDFQALKYCADNRIPKGILKKINELIVELDEYEELYFSLSHGDFTSWNILLSKEKLFVYDWELSDSLRPIGFDFFHFLIQGNILEQRNNWKEITKIIDTQLNENNTSPLFVLLNKYKDKYLKLYLLFNTIYYLKKYTQQANWHQQIYWLLNVWNEAFDSLLMHKYKNRELVLIDLFDFLLPMNYTIIKGEVLPPEATNENSDIDLFSTKQVSLSIRKWIQSHSMVKSVQYINKSFMSVLHIFLKDGSILHIDVIWDFKWKNIHLLSSKQFLKNVTLNLHGIKTPDPHNTARYIGLFYGLNKAEIPHKYNYYEELLAHSEDPIDKHIHLFFIDKYTSPDNLYHYLKTIKENKNFNFFLNSLKYFYDTILTIFKEKGMIVTFSGVDGSGKTTLVENIQYRIEKQLRKKVIVLRHRPSILPILSSWIKGKEKAEQDSIQSLPRTGNNNSFFSSLLRFSYYYMDFFIGQFYIYLKYICRNYVVLYDRYYFDFMFDSKRSNIQLPALISKCGYLFLLKPKINFFLYADSKTILKRKQELNEATIKELNQTYIENFNKLNEESKTSRYLTIKNEQLHESLLIVLNEIKNTAA